MKLSTHTTDMLINSLWRLVHKYCELEKHPVRYNEDIKLPPGEIHTIQAIGKNENINIKELGDYFGISKSAASQMVSKLVKKGYVNKANQSGNNKELCLKLTSQGWEAFSIHESFHNQHHEELIFKLENLFSDSELKKSENILRVIENIIDERIEIMSLKK